MALVSDAGTPLVSDPGYKLVRDAIAAGIEVFAVPGPSAALAGLLVSGLPTDRFFVAGFLPTRRSPRRRAIAELAPVPGTLIVFEAARRLPDALADLTAELGPRPAAVARELTKRFEEVRRGSLAELAAHYGQAGAPRGEVVIVIGPPARAALSRRPPSSTSSWPRRSRAARRLPLPQPSPPPPGSRGAASTDARWRCRAGEPRRPRGLGALGREPRRLEPAAARLSHRRPALSHAARRDRSDGAARPSRGFRGGQGAHGSRAGAGGADLRQRQRTARAAELFLLRRPDLAGHTLRFDLIAVRPWRLPRHLADAWRLS